MRVQTNLVGHADSPNQIIFRRKDKSNIKITPDNVYINPENQDEGADTFTSDSDDSDG